MSIKFGDRVGPLSPEVYMAAHGARNAMKSWVKSDSGFDMATGDLLLGPDDYALLTKLASSGSSHAKFLRQISVTVNIVAPLYWWKQFDTYKIGTTANSESTMHTITNRPISMNDFDIEWDKIKDIQSMKNPALIEVEFLNDATRAFDSFAKTIETLNFLRERYLSSKDSNYWKLLIQMLPDSYIQMRTVTLNYQVLRTIYFDRRHHKLLEWHDFCETFIKKLPLSTWITVETISGLPFPSSATILSLGDGIKLGDLAFGRNKII